jgi:hypothetical protein
MLLRTIRFPTAEGPRLIALPSALRRAIRNNMLVRLMQRI